VPTKSVPETFLETCSGCGVCRDACPVLDRCGLPDELVQAGPDIAFSCAGCGACREACPLGLDPGEILRQARESVVASGGAPPQVGKALNGALSFARTGHRPPFRYYGAAATVFWPGCGLAGTSPSAVKKIAELLERRLAEPVGIVLDCCFDPAGQLGDNDALQKALPEIRARLQAGKTVLIITGCLNCRKVFARYLPEFKIEFVLDVLSDEIAFDRLPRAYFLHHPCPSLMFPETRRGIEDALSRSAEARMEDSLAACCGQGGGLASLAPDLSGQFAQRIIRMAGNLPIVSYCTGCTNQFGKKGREVRHLFSFLPGMEPLPPGVSMRSHWLNRFLLSASLHLRGALSRKWPAVLLIVLLLLCGIFLNSQGFFSAERVLVLLRQYPVAAPVIFMAIYAVSPSLLLPSIPLTVAAGFLWGPVWGVVFSIVGATIGSCLPFFLARYVLSSLIRQRFKRDQWAWLTEKVEMHGWKAVAFTRLIPVFPFNLLNYLFGLTPIPFRHYLASTFIFMLPGCIAFVAFGSSLGALLLTGSMRGVILGLAVAAAAIVLSIAFKPYFRKIVGSDKNEPPQPAGKTPGGGAEGGGS
jgi:uncharacterized membrane protein YdjX (TVP38/TMEM64 family)/Fe-S oxidoreductase